MAFFKRLTPNKGANKENDTKVPTQTPPPVAPQGDGSSVNALRRPSNGQQTPAPAGQTRVNPHAPAGEHAAPAGSDQVIRKMGGRDAARPVNDEMVPTDEAGSRLRGPAQGLPELQVSKDTDMLKLLCDQAGLTYVRLGDYNKADITPQLLRLIPSEVARAKKVFPIRQAPDGTVTMAITDPLNVRIVDDLRLMLHDKGLGNLEAVVANEEEVMDYINRFYGIGDQTLDQMVEEFEKQDTTDAALAAREGAVDLSDIEKISSEGPVIRFCNLLLLQAVKERASDIHIEPFSNMLRIRYRVDGVLREIPSPPKSWQLGVLSRFKVIGGMDIAELRRPQDGRLKLTIDGREIDMRVSTLPVAHGECIVMRLLDKSMMMVGVQQIGMTPEVLEHFMKLIDRPNGILLVTGPTGSGKTTTLYAALNEINDPGDKIITTEDPVEYQLDGIIQIMINENVGLTFAACLRAILRQDPDVILVGEIRDTETAQIAIQASLTGHLVFSTLHTNSAAGTITRLIDMGVEPFLITSTLEGIIAQRLVRMTCPNCRKPYQPTDEELADFGTTRAEVADITFLKGIGCDECANSGYKGRIGIFELLPIDDDARDLILDRATTDEIHESAVRKGMKTMRQDGWLKICLGVTTFDEVARHTPRESQAMIREEMQDILKETVGATGSEKMEKPAVQMTTLSGASSAPAPAAPAAATTAPPTREAAVRPAEFDVDSLPPLPELPDME